MRLVYPLLPLLVLLVAPPPAVAGDDDAAALSLADKTSATAAETSNWHLYLEAAASEARPQDPGFAVHGMRLSFDAKFDDSFAPGWRAVFADHVDFTRMDGTPGNQDINTLKEAYLSWHAQPDLIADFGRINVRNGVGAGYNPTDYFRADAVRSIISIDPASLRENRLGTVMLRGQTLWESGSLTALYAPELVSQATTNGFSPDLGATNQHARWQLALSEKLSDKFSPQWLLTGGAGLSPQLGMNLTALVNDATVAFFEWSGGHSAPLLAQALMTPANEGFHSHAATGLTYTTSNNVSFTAEYEYNGAGLDQADWNSLQRGSFPPYFAYRTYVANILDLPTTRNLFFYSSWQDAMIKHLDISGLVRYDLIDNSRLQWLETRYHWTTVDVALQWQLEDGHQTSDYGALPNRRLWQLLARFYF
jgi:hypothetical protein